MSGTQFMLFLSCNLRVQNDVQFMLFSLSDLRLKNYTNFALFVTLPTSKKTLRAELLGTHTTRVMWPIRPFVGPF